MVGTITWYRVNFSGYNNNNNNDNNNNNNNTCPMAERQVFMLGRDGHMPPGRIIRHWVRPRGRCCSGTRHFSQRGKICQQCEYLFAPIAVETFGPMNTSAYQLFANLRRKISSASGDDREGAFLYQRVLVMAQRYNAVLIHDTLPATDCTD